jgi:threonine dehydratase
VVTLLDIDAARRRIAPFVTPTPLVEWVSRDPGEASPVRLKLESVNHTCSFKVRGAFNALLRLVEAHPDAATRPPVVTASAGNHGRAMAYAAERLGLPVMVFTPATAPRAKRDAIRRHGATLDDTAPSYDEAEQWARAWVGARGGVFISPYNHPDVIAGAGTVALEIVEACSDVATVVLPIGGGGLASGVGVALRAVAPGCRLVAVEAAASTPFTAALAHGALTPIVAGPTLADGLAGNVEPGAITFPLVQRVVDEVVVVPEAALRDAMRRLAADAHLIAEGSAAVAMAAVLSGRIRPRPGPVVVVVTGANVDLETWLEAVSG